MHKKNPNWCTGKLFLCASVDQCLGVCVKKTWLSYSLPSFNRSHVISWVGQCVPDAETSSWAKCLISGLIRDSLPPPFSPCISVFHVTLPLLSVCVKPQMTCDVPMNPALFTSCANHRQSASINRSRYSRGEFWSSWRQFYDETCSGQTHSWWVVFGDMSYLLLYLHVASHVPRGMHPIWCHSQSGNSLW